MSSPGRTVGLISDTHGTLDARVFEAFEGVERILHAGDVGTHQVLWELGAIAPVTAVGGNTDVGRAVGEDLHGFERIEVNGCRIALVHSRRDVPREIVASSDVVVFGHSHRPLVEYVDGVLWVNPGSAAQPRGAAIGRSVSLLELDEGGAPRARIVALSEFGEGS